MKNLSLETIEVPSGVASTLRTLSAHRAEALFAITQAMRALLNEATELTPDSTITDFLSEFSYLLLHLPPANKT